MTNGRARSQVESEGSVLDDQTTRMVAQQHDEGAEGRRSLGRDVLARAQTVDHIAAAEVTAPERQAITA